MSLAMLQGYLKEGDNYQTLDVKTLRYCKIIWLIFVQAIFLAASMEFR